MADPMDASAAPGNVLIPDVEPWSETDEAELGKAVAVLEGTRFAHRIGGVLGRKIGLLDDMIPGEVTKIANRAAGAALRYALRGAVATLPKGSSTVSPKWHMAAIAASGAVGGAFGLATLPIELPVSTALMLRAIAAIARQEGEDLRDPAANLACIEVFALGTGHDAVPLGQSGYFAARTVMAKSVTEAARHLVQRGLVEDSAPVLLRLLGQVASRFGLVVTQKVMAQAVPIIGAAAGAAINAAFMDHYQALARGHFIVRKLERRHGTAKVHVAYERIRARNEPDSVAGPAADGAHTAVTLEASPGIEPGCKDLQSSA